jgi:hypothetical protein
VLYIDEREESLDEGRAIPGMEGVLVLLLVDSNCRARAELNTACGLALSSGRHPEEVFNGTEESNVGNSSEINTST